MRANKPASGAAVPCAPAGRRLARISVDYATYATAELCEPRRRSAGAAAARLSPTSAYAVIHTIVENQVALGDEIPVLRTLDRRMS